MMDNSNRRSHKATSRTGSAKSNVSSKSSKSRRSNTFKKSQPMKSLDQQALLQCKTRVFHRGMYYEVGDVVSMTDCADGRAYYAQIRGILQDEYFQRSAAVTWLIPLKGTDLTRGFDPSTFILGPQEELPRNLDYMTFVCHAPSDYFTTLRPKCAPGELKPLDELRFNSCVSVLQGNIHPTSLDKIRLPVKT